jgi:hypothetical protein
MLRPTRTKAPVQSDDTRATHRGNTLTQHKKCDDGASMGAATGRAGDASSDDVLIDPCIATGLPPAEHCRLLALG